MGHPRIAQEIMVTKLVTLQPDHDVFQAMRLLLKYRITGAPVIDNERNFAGVFSDKRSMIVLSAILKVLAERDDPRNALPKAKDIMAARLVTLTPQMDAFEAIGYLLKHRISGAPVLDPQGCLLGVFSERYSMSVLINSAYDQLPTTDVSAFLNTDFGRAISEEIDLLSMVEIFLDNYYRRLPVLRDGKLLGQVSRRDVLQAALKLFSHAQGRQAVERFLSSQNNAAGEMSAAVETFMNKDALTITEETELLKIAEIFLHTNNRRLPVLRDGKLLGQVSRRDVLQAALDLNSFAPKDESSLLYLSSLVERGDAPVE